ncbi:MAG: serine/threonine protein phosphatase [Alkalinema sp. RL_2_19]|nr:serine/threonine protein phosphatase [Alkalinema sp. RL_2_19]
MSNCATRRIVIGDVHGHYDGLMQLLDTIAPGADDEIYFLGDLIDRGPKSAQVVDFVRQHDYACVLGNHEQMAIEAFPDSEISPPALQAWLHSGGRATLASYEDPVLIMEHLEWFQTLPSYIDLGDLWLVHAGVHPQMPLHEQDREQFCWIREPFHNVSEPIFGDKLIITGHTITFTFPGVAPGAIVQGNGWIDIDTGAYHPRSGWMTAYDTTNQTVYQVQVYEHQVRVLPLDEVRIKVDQQSLSRRQAMVI